MNTQDKMYIEDLLEQIESLQAELAVCREAIAEQKKDASRLSDMSLRELVGLLPCSQASREYFALTLPAQELLE